jgi:hypothetical protein
MCNKEKEGKLEIGKTRMEMPWADDDVLFVSKELYESRMPHHEISSGKRRAPMLENTGIGYTEKLTLVADLNGKRDAATSELLGMGRNFIYSSCRANKKRPIPNHAARTIALKLADDLDANELVSYADEEPDWDNKTSKKILRWPSRNFRVLPHPIYDEDNPLFDESDLPRFELFQIISNSNIAIKRFSEIHNMPGLQHYLVGSNKKEITDVGAEQFNQYVQKRRKENPEKVIDDGRTRMDMPEADDDVLFLGDDFQGISFHKKAQHHNQNSADQSEYAQLIKNLPPGLWKEAQEQAQKDEKISGVVYRPSSNEKSATAEVRWTQKNGQRRKQLLKSGEGYDGVTIKALAIALKRDREKWKETAK